MIDDRVSLLASALPALPAFIFTILLMIAFIPAARAFGLVDRPDGSRKLHVRPVPVVGGFAIAAAAASVSLALGQSALGLTLGAALLLVAGMLDDKLDLSWKLRFPIQAAAAALMIVGDQLTVTSIGPIFNLPDTPLGPLAFPLTLLGVVALINAVNMTDGIDGLAGGLGAGALLMFMIAAAANGNAALVVVLGPPLGAVSGFLMWNLRSPWMKQARVYLGNSGSEFLGLLLAWAALNLTHSPAHPVSLLLVPFCLAPALADSIVVMLRRAANGANPFRGDRDHLHHLLLDAGFGVSTVVGLLCGGSLLLGAIAGALLALGAPQAWLGIGFLVLVAAQLVITFDRKLAVRRLAQLRHARFRTA
ncbi:glycosyltransferase family 4 protein [Phenylobacterium sp. VNQ135]|uniref:glycosyltransferase family 4 protein n=1 Tax=Phenylobacterium sp. VNQ135 TaxID=3400922 RepID=UPI003C0EF4A5